MLCVNLISAFSLLWVGGWCLDLKFPPGFQFGAATSAYQVEGAWNVSDKGENIWDSMLHSNPSLISDGMNGDVSCDSYHQWRTDVQMAHNLGLHFYRFSVSWSRILPTGFPNRISEDGAKYYNKLIDGLLKKGIEPVVTLYHFDLPQSIQTLGGWTNPLIADWFADYARIVFRLYADRVKTWITINEPLIMCDHIYNLGNVVPMVHEEELGPFLCNKNVLLAHAKAWRIYDEDFKPQYNGKLSIANNPIWLDPASEKDEELTELAREFGAGRYSDPIYSAEGGWPPSIEKIMAEYSKKQGYPYSRLPSFTDEEKKLIQGTYDFYSLNHYTARLVREAHKNETPGPWFVAGSKELNAVLEIDPTWAYTDLSYLAVAPKGIRRQIKWLKDRYNNVSILITENGFATRDPDLYDTGRINFIRDYLKEILLAIKEDGANVIGYTVWSLMDNFEWMFGYSLKFGLYSVDFKDPQRLREPRASAFFYSSVIKHHSLDIPHSSHQYHHLKRKNLIQDKTSATSRIRVNCELMLIYTLSLAYILVKTMH
ncbi:jg24606 [Pararge aegeria aegeria]|uniref:beta-glucosidase n=1 Tax=Pararge aegeria aegeria TaxID=348720 RepID=A0A8S4RMA3_9NEOP|nr:jg24606 [Pararge aegeria aegeria]